MSKLRELIKELCPEGVEYKKLGEIGNLSRGKVYSKTYLAENQGDYPVYSSQTANNGELGKISTYDYDGEFLTWTTDGAYAGTIFHRKGKFSITNVCGLISLKSEDISIRFLYYWLSIEAPKHVYQGMGNPKLMSNQMERVPIPLPPLPVQEEIVRILDKFTELIALLKEELQARKEQYEYYRNKLLTFGENVERKTLGECTSKISNIKWNNTHTDYKYIDLSSVNRENNRIETTTIINKGNAPSRAQQIVAKDDVLFGTTRPLLKRYCVIDENYDGQVCSTGFCVLRANTKTVLPKWIYYQITTNDFFTHAKKYQQGASYPSITDSNVKSYTIPVPPLEEQQRIVAILDKFDTLINDFNEGIPAEIRARQEQYEYYRNKLLTFKNINDRPKSDS